MNNPSEYHDFARLILSIAGFVVLVSIQLKGILYDAERKKYEPKYTGNNSFQVFAQTQIRFSFPIPIFHRNDKGKHEVLKRQMNIRIFLFWTIVLLFILGEQFFK